MLLQLINFLKTYSLNSLPVLTHLDLAALLFSRQATENE